MNRLSAKINQARIAAGLTEKELAAKCGLSVSYILQVESGKKIVNESVADKILKTLGTKEEFVAEEKLAEKPAPAVEKAVKPQAKIVVEPSEAWTDALAGVIKKFPVIDLASGKAVDYRELPIIGKKIIGHQPDKISFVKAANSEMAAFRIEKGDVLTVMITKEIQNDGIYLVQIDGKKMIRQLRKEKSKLKLSRCLDDAAAVSVDLLKVEVLGRIIGNAFDI